MKAVDRAYLAGILDGEGSISIRQGTQGPGREHEDAWKLSVEVMNRSEELILWLDDRFEGSIGIRNRGGNRSQIFYWYITGRRARPVLEAALPYLLIKRVHAELALRFIDTISTKGTRTHRLGQEVRVLREAITKEIKLLNVRGADA